MPNYSSAIVSKVWSYAHVLKTVGAGNGDYIEQITCMLFLKLLEDVKEVIDRLVCADKRPLQDSEVLNSVQGHLRILERGSTRICEL